MNDLPFSDPKLKPGSTHFKHPQLRKGMASTSLSAGLTILEVLVAVLIATSAITVLIPGLSRQLQYVQDSSKMNSVEAVISRDLDWIRTYARYWKMKSGPLSSSNFTRFTKSSSFSPSALIDYEPPGDDCKNENPSNNSFSLANRFISDAQSYDVNNNSDFKPPFPIASGSFSSFAGLPSSISLTRTITPKGSRVVVSYEAFIDVPNALGASSKAPYLTRVSSLFLQSSAWCETLN